MPPHWSSPSAIMESAAQGYRLDRWEEQEYHVEVWCEKDALSSVIEPVCERYHVRFMTNRGYSSSTAMYDAAQRLAAAADERGKWPVVVYLGDHDPSGLDMTRDIRDRLELMTRGLAMDVDRLALNYDQVQQHQPPPNPAKLKDSRAGRYISMYGMESWELDALEPQFLDQMIGGAIEQFLDMELYKQMIEQEEEGRETIRKAARLMEEQ